MPSAIKDLFDFKPGWPFTFGGVRAMSDCVARWHCVFAERIEKAGAILLGKTNSPTMGLRGTCDNYLFGPTRNPFDVRKNSGGSSGGSAAAVADGLVPFAEGTDAGGSIRIPAAWCNVVGFKASFGRVPVVMRPNAFAGDTPFVFEGPISRSVEDAALALTALAGYDPRDPFSIETHGRFSRRGRAPLDQRLEDRLHARTSGLSGRAGNPSGGRRGGARLHGGRRDRRRGRRRPQARPARIERRLDAADDALTSARSTE